MAVYTKLSNTEIADFLSLYDLPQLAKASGILSGISNTNYLLELTDDTKLILTLFEQNIDEQELPFFIELIDHLAARQIPCPKPIRSKKGAAIATLGGKSATMVSFLQGGGIDKIENQHIAELGTAIAKMHLAGQQYTGKLENRFALDFCKDLIGKIGTRSDIISTSLSQELAQEIEFLQNNPVQDLPSGIIHADLFPDNVLFDDSGKLTGIIDFYFACNGFFAYDLAIIINAWCFDELVFNNQKAEILINSYCEVRQLSKQELQAMPTLLRAASLRFLSSRLYDNLFPVADATLTPKDPLEYLAKLRFHRNNYHL